MDNDDDDECFPLLSNLPNTMRASPSAGSIISPNNLHAFYNFNFDPETRNNPIPPALEPHAPPRKKRVVVCPICGILGHMRKTCPQKNMPTEAAVVNATTSPEEAAFSPLTEVPPVQPVDDSDGDSSGGSEAGSGLEDEYMDPQILEEHENDERMEQEALLRLFPPTVDGDV